VWWSGQKAGGQVASATKVPPSKAAVAKATGKSPSLTPASTSGKPAGSSESSQSAGEGRGNLAPPAKIAVGSSGAAAQQVVTDDGKLLWASPTTGKPVSFRCVPPEGQ